MEHDQLEYKNISELYGTGLYNDVIETLENEVKNIAEVKYPRCYKNDLDFYVSRLFSKTTESEKIILTIDHMGRKFSRYLFPEEDSFYGNSALVDIMDNLYCQTM